MQIDTRSYFSPFFFFSNHDKEEILYIKFVCEYFPFPLSTHLEKKEKEKEKRGIERVKRGRGLLSGRPVNIESISITFWARQKAVIVRM